MVDGRHFYRVMRMHSADYATARCPSVTCRIKSKRL